MKKILMCMIISFITLIMPYKVFGLSTVDANQKIDIDKECTLTLNYLYDDYNLTDIGVKLYLVATITPDYQYQISSHFSNYLIKINGLKTEQEWNILKETINSYIIADNIKEEISTTISNNTIQFFNLNPGLYLVKTEKIDIENYELVFDSFLINVPELKEDGSWNYNVTAYPKPLEYTPKYEEVVYKVIKEWDDNKNNRPESIDIDIYKDGVLHTNTTLTKKDNWIYEWKTIDDGSTWTVVERNIKGDYNVSITKRDNTFIIINKESGQLEENPNTIDDIGLYFYLFAISLIGIVILVLYFILKKKSVR